MIRYSYNAQMQPPAPFVHITLRNPADGTEVKNVPAQLDSAADRTVFPNALVQALGLTQIGTVSIAGLGSVVYALPTFPVLLGVHDRPLQPFKIVGADEPWVLLGRDVMNNHRFFLDGPQFALEIH